MSVIKRNIVWLLISQAATWVATFVTLLIVPNKLGSTDFGTLGYTVGFLQFFMLFAGLGTGVFVSREVARDRTIFGDLVWNAVLLKIVLWAVVSAAAFALAIALGNRGETLALIAIGCAAMLPALLTEVFTAALGGLEQLAKPAMWAVVSMYFQTIVGVGVLLAGGGLIVYALVVSVSSLIPLTATALMSRPYLRGHRVFRFATWRMLVVGGVPLLTLAFLTLTYGTLDVPILHSISGSEPVGWYTVAMRWGSLPVFITTAVVGAHFPAFSKHGKPLTDYFAPLVNRSIHVVLLVTIPSAVGLFFVADQIITLLYDASFDNATVLVQIIAIGVPIMAMDTILGTALVATDRLKRYMVVAGSAAVMNPILCIVAIHAADSRWQNGAIGAAFATVVTELWIMVGALRLKAPGVLDGASVVRILRIAAASALMVPVLLLSSSWPLLARIPLGVVAYGIGAFLFGCVSRAELTDLVASVRRGNPPAGEEPDNGDVVMETAVGPLAVPVMPPGDEDPVGP